MFDSIMFIHFWLKPFGCPPTIPGDVQGAMEHRKDEVPGEASQRKELHRALKMVIRHVPLRWLKHVNHNFMFQPRNL
jgi:hypothetical protein